MPANGRWDLIRRLKVKLLLKYFLIPTYTFSLALLESIGSSSFRVAFI